jgi:hypothetical protein
MSTVSLDLTAEGLEIEVFPVDLGSEIILGIIGRSSYSQQEREAAKNLSAHVGGLGLGLAVVASRIRLTGNSVAAFLELYKQHPGRLDKERRGIEKYYKLTIGDFLDSTFDSLGEDARKLLEIIAFMAPDRIPREIFERDLMPDDLAFCSDPWRYVSNPIKRSNTD